MNNVPMPASAGRVYQLTENSVSPTRVAGRDANGIPREETICMLAKHAKYVDSSGNICDVPLQTSRVYNQGPEAQRAEQMFHMDQIAGGSLPLAECPYTAEYRRATGSPTLLGELPDGVKPCDGAPDGCEHLRPVIAARRAKSRAAYDIANKSADTVSVEQVEKIARSLGEGMATGRAAVKPPKMVAE